MTTSPPLLAALMALYLLPFAYPRDSSNQAYEVGRWRLDVHRDAFRQENGCRLADDYGHFPRAVGGQHALVLKLPDHADGSTAWFSVDGAPAKPWRDIEAVLIADGTMARAEALDNATGGKLPLPYTVIHQAQAVTVQMKRDGPKTRYSLVGLWPMLQAAERLGCRFPEDG